MTGRIYASLCLDIEVHDLEQLKTAAAARALEEGMAPADWEDTRLGPGDDLRMLLDPGSIPGAGFSINDSTCETLGA